MLADCTGTRHEVHESYNRNITKKPSGTAKDRRKIHRKAMLSFSVRQKTDPFTSESTQPQR